MPATKFVFRKIRSPDGKVFDIPNMSQFARERGLNAKGFEHVLLGHYEQYEGWTRVGKIARVFKRGPATIKACRN